MVIKLCCHSHDKTWNFGNLTKIRNEEYIQTVNFYEKDGRVLKALCCKTAQPGAPGVSVAQINLD